MGLYGFFVCDQCRVQLWLGKAVHRGDGKIDHFHRADADAPKNWADPQFARALCRILADHARHPLRVVVEGDPGHDQVAAYREIGGDTNAGISFEEYLQGWAG